MSSTERSRQFREKLKIDEEKLEAYRRTDRERKKRDYEKAKSTLSEKEKLKKKLKKREMQRSWRAKKKSLHLSDMQICLKSHLLLAILLVFPHTVH